MTIIQGSFFCWMQLISDKGKIAGALKRELAGIALCQHAIFSAVNGKFHAVAAFHLEGDIIPGGAVGGIAMGPGDVAAVGEAVVGDLRAPGHDPGGDRKLGRMVILSTGGAATDGYSCGNA